MLAGNHSQEVPFEKAVKMFINRNSVHAKILYKILTKETMVIPALDQGWNFDKAYEYYNTKECQELFGC